MGRSGYERFSACDTANDDVCLIAFTSGTTGEPKGTMHFHRDRLATCDSDGRDALCAQPSDRFIGSPPIAFTFGLGGLVLFPLRVGAAAILLKRAADDLLAGIEKFAATVSFTAPTAYPGTLPKSTSTTLQPCASASRQGRCSPKAIFDAWLAATGIKICHGPPRRQRPPPAPENAAHPRRGLRQAR